MCISGFRMPTLPKNLTKFLAQSKVRDRLYHGTDKDFSVYDASKLGANEDRAHQTSQLGFFSTRDPSEASLYSGGKEGANVQPVHMAIKKPYVTSWNDIAELDGYELKKQLQSQGYDGVIIKDKGMPDNFVAFEPTQIKSAIGNRGTFDPTNPDITKAEGGKINPIKTPQQMLLEAAGIPHMAEGSAAPNPKKLGLELMKRAIKDYVRINNRQPNTAELEALTKQVQMMSAPTGYQPIGTPQAAARARHELATDPNLLDPNRADPFVTQMTLGRASNRTWLKPKTLDVNDPNVAKSIEAKQVEGLADEGIYGVGQSSTPASDAISKIAKKWTGVHQYFLSRPKGGGHQAIQQNCPKISG